MTFDQRPKYGVTYTTGRAVLVGHCPDCGQVLVVFNNHEAWPLVHCHCGWEDSTHDLDNGVRYDNDWNKETA